MSIVLWIVLLVVSYVIGVLGFTQIIGSLQTRQKNFLVPLLIWLVILVGIYFAARKLLPDKMLALYVGYGVSLLQTLFAGKIQ